VAVEDTNRRIRGRRRIQGVVIGDVLLVGASTFRLRWLPAKNIRASY
jgi:hypothetical protein